LTDGAFHPEDIARAAIDRSLAACGWVVQSRSAMNVGAAQGVAVREFQTDSGPVDYALFVDRTLCGVIEAKPEGTTLSAFSEQAERYIVAREERSQADLGILSWLVAAVSAARIMDDKRASHSSRRRKL